RDRAGRRETAGRKIGCLRNALQKLAVGQMLGGNQAAVENDSQEARGIDVGQVRGNHLMAERALVKHALQATHQRSFDHGHGCSLLVIFRRSLLRRSLLPRSVLRRSPRYWSRGGSPNSRTLLRTVRRLTPSNSAARARLPPVDSRVMAKSWRSISPSDRPAFHSGEQGTRAGRLFPCSNASTPISPPRDKATARRTKFPSSRTLPGQACSSRRATSSRDKWTSVPGAA